MDLGAEQCANDRRGVPCCTAGGLGWKLGLGPDIAVVQPFLPNEAREPTQSAAGEFTAQNQEKIHSHGRQGQGHQQEQEPCRSNHGIQARRPGQCLPGSSETTGHQSIATAHVLPSFRAHFSLLRFCKSYKDPHPPPTTYPHPGRSLGESEYRHPPDDVIRGQQKWGAMHVSDKRLQEQGPIPGPPRDRGWGCRSMGASIARTAQEVKALTKN